MHAPRWHHGTAIELEALARSGDTWAMRRLSDLMQCGLRGVPRDPAQAAGWVEYAARAGSARAALRLGDRYQRGVGVAPNASYAIGWWRVAAEAGLMDARVNLASVLLEGDASHPAGSDRHNDHIRNEHCGSGFGAHPRRRIDHDDVEPLRDGREVAAKHFRVDRDHRRPVVRGLCGTQ